MRLSLSISCFEGKTMIEGIAHAAGDLVVLESVDVDRALPGQHEALHAGYVEGAGTRHRRGRAPVDGAARAHNLRIFLALLLDPAIEVRHQAPIDTRLRAERRRPGV